MLPFRLYYLVKIGTLRRLGGIRLSLEAIALLALGVGKDIAINFSLASGLLLTTSATAAALCGTALSLTTLALGRRRRTPSPSAAI